VFLAVKKVQY